MKNTLFYQEQPIQPIRPDELNINKDTPIFAPYQVDIPLVERKLEIVTKRHLEIKNLNKF